jgi:hypothetical protein
LILRLKFEHQSLVKRMSISRNSAPNYDFITENFQITKKISLFDDDFLELPRFEFLKRSFQSSFATVLCPFMHTKFTFPFFAPKLFPN